MYVPGAVSGETTKQEQTMSSCKKAKKSAPKRVDANNVSVAIAAINAAMRRKGLSLGDMYAAITCLVDEAVIGTILHMRAAGCSIRKIARKVHMDDRRVSNVIKEAAAKEAKAKAKKPCKTCKK